MTTFYTQIFTCSGCARKLINYQLSSYHIFESDVFSDGWIDNTPPGLFGSNIVFCPECDYPFWANDIVDEDVSNDTETFEVKKLDHFIPFGEENRYIKMSTYLLGLLNRGFAKGDTTKEIIIRLDIWRIFNHIFRFKNKKGNIAGNVLNRLSGNRNWESSTEELFVANLKRISEIMEPVYYDELILLAEIFREIGIFKMHY